MTLSAAEMEALEAAAFAEGRAFRLPADWDLGRERLEGAWAVDGLGSLDKDDAIRFVDTPNGPQLTVMISEVPTFVVPSLAMAARAEILGESTYEGSQCIVPMLPREVSEGRLSLLPNQETPVLAMTINLIDGIPHFQQGRAQPRSMTYNQINRLAAGRGKLEDVQAVRYQVAVAQSLLERRQKRGALVFYDPVRRIMIDEEGSVNQARDAAQLIIQESMILANATLGRFMRDHDIPRIERAHHFRADIDMSDALEVLLSGNAPAIEDLKRKLGRAYFTTESEGHEALGEEAYARWTSPLRLLDALVNTANTLAFLQNKAYPYPKERCQVLCDHLNELIERRVSPLEMIDRKVIARRLGHQAVEMAREDDQEFAKLVLLASETGMLRRSFLEVINERAANKSLRPREVSMLLFSRHLSKPRWGQIRAILMSYVCVPDYDALGVLSSAQARGLLSDLRYDLKGHNLGFVCESTLSREVNGTGTNHVAEGTSKRHAKRQAAAGLVREVVNTADAYARRLPQAA